MTSYTSNLTIKAWAEQDRPREKMLLKGRQSLSDAELIAILLGSGNRRESAVGLAQRILQSFENNLNQLARCTLAELMSFRGVGQAKAISIAAALEIGRRRQLADIKEQPQIRESKDAYNVIAPLIADLQHEEFWILLLNRSNRVIGRERVSMGGVSGTVVDAKIIFRRAVVNLASSLILCHNHPSGSLKPSQADIDITKKLFRAGADLDITVHDHLIICQSGYFSFADEDMI